MKKKNIVMQNLDADIVFYAVLNCDSFLVNLSNHLDFSNPNFITKIPNPESPELPAHYKLFHHERT